MYLNTVTAFVGFSTAGRPQIYAKAWLVCPQCRNVTDVETHPAVIEKRNWLPTKPSDPALADEVLRPQRKLPVMDYQGMAEVGIKQSRNCERCGVSSVLPRNDAERLKKELARQITEEWIVQQVIALNSCLSHQAELASPAAKLELKS